MRQIRFQREKLVLLTKTGIAKAERGRMVNLRTAERLAGALGVKLEALVKS